MTKYIGRRDSGLDELTVVVEHDGVESLLNPRWDIRNHSPDGFETSYNGSGPAQLALAILCSHFGEDTVRAEYYYQHYKDMVIARIPRDKREWTITDSEVTATVRLIDERYPSLFQKYEEEKAYRLEMADLLRQEKEAI